MTGYAYKRWKKGLNAMLPKKDGVFWVHKLCTILLLKADANMNYKKLHRDVMWFAKQSDSFDPSNYGGMHGVQAVEAPLDSRLTGDLLRQKRKAAGMASTDAKGCFDRIVHSIAFICLRSFGMQKAPITSMLQAIREMTHHIRTAFGDSETSYGFDPNNPLDHPQQGLLQGNGAAVTGWNAIISKIMSMMLDAGFDLTVWSAITRAVIKFICINFIDDGSLFLGGPSNTTPGSEVYNRMQTLLDMWESALRATGGAVAFDKSYWYLIDFHWNGNSWQYIPKEKSPGDLTLPQNTPGRERAVIPRLNPHEARELLGVMLQPDGNETSQYKHLLAKAKKWKDAVRSHHIKQHDAWYTLNASIMKTLEYPLMATTMTRKQCSDIMSPVLMGALPSQMWDTG